MTARALVLAMVALATLLSAVNVQAGWLFVLGGLFLGALMLSLAGSYWALRGVRAEVRHEGRAMRGEALACQVHLRHSGRWPRWFLAVGGPPIGPVIRGPGFLFRIRPLTWSCAILPELPPRAEATIELDLPAPRRGVHEPPAVWVQASVLGFLFWRRRAASVHPVRVVPRIHPLRRLPWFRAAGATGDDHPQARTVPEGELVRGTRDYRPGDPLRAIHWRGTARRNRLVVKETEGLAPSGGACLILDLAGHEPDTFEHALEVAASLLAHWNAQGIFTRLVVPEGILEGDLFDLLDRLAGLEPGEASLAPVLSQVDPAGAVVVSRRAAGWGALASAWVHVGRADEPVPAGAVGCPVGADPGEALAEVRG
ncbi:MAG: DUF58 domain-containing protein [Candidatus Sericytochromatia bacterium]|nr:DUF58 domain-containing protein [Candidatus Sericytochromatia bacterium]